MKPDTVVLTLQDRIFPNEQGKRFLDLEMAQYQRLKRKMFKDLYGEHRAENLNDYKKDFLKVHEITSTEFNSLKNECDMIFKSQLELQKTYADDYKNQRLFGAQLYCLSDCDVRHGGGLYVASSFDF